MRANQAEHAVATMCRVLGVSPSEYYAWRGRGRSHRAKRDEVLRGTIRTIHQQSRGTYGVPRVHAELVAGGCRVSRRRVARLMREVGLAGVSRRRGTRTTRVDASHRGAPDRVERQFQADAPDRIWVADITYVIAGCQPGGIIIEAIRVMDRRLGLKLPGELADVVQGKEVEDQQASVLAWQAEQTGEAIAESAIACQQHLADGGYIERMIWERMEFRSSNRVTRLRLSPESEYVHGVGLQTRTLSPTRRGCLAVAGAVCNRRSLTPSTPPVSATSSDRCESPARSPHPLARYR